MAAHERRLSACSRHLLRLPPRLRPQPAAAQQEADDRAAEIVALAGSPSFGVEVKGLDIRACLRRGWAQGHEDGGAEYLDAVVATHGLVLFRNQLPTLTAEELVEFSKWFGSGKLHSARAKLPSICFPTQRMPLCRDGLHPVRQLTQAGGRA
jgi:alpha-ketoglutarate-dependent taurine dioxygenase